MKKLISERQLASMRSCAAHVLADTCTIQTPTRTLDAVGSPTVTWADTTNVPCKLLAGVTEGRSAEGHQYQIHRYWVLVLPHDQTIASGNRAVIGGDTYEVLSVEDDTTWRTVRRAHLRRVE